MTTQFLLLKTDFSRNKMKDITQKDHQHGQLGDAQLTVMGIGIKCLDIRGLVPFSTRTIGSLFLE